MTDREAQDKRTRLIEELRAAVVNGRDDVTPDMLEDAADLLEADAKPASEDRRGRLEQLVERLRSNAEFLDRRLNGNDKVRRQTLRRWGNDMREAAALLTARDATPDYEWMKQRLAWYHAENERLSVLLQGDATPPTQETD